MAFSNRIKMSGCTLAVLCLLVTENSFAQQSSGSVTTDSAQVEGRIDPQAGQYDGRVLTRSELIQGYIDLGIRQLGGSIDGRSGSLEGQIDYGTGVLRGRINGQEFILDTNSIRNQIEAYRSSRVRNGDDDVQQILGIVNQIIQSRRNEKEQRQNVDPENPVENGFPGEPIPDGGVGELQPADDAQEFSTDDEVANDETDNEQPQKPTVAPPEPYQPVFITNHTSKKMAFELRTEKSDWIRVSIDPDDELELDGTQKLKIRYLSDSIHTYSLEKGQSYRFKSTDGVVNFFSYEREEKAAAKPENEPEEQVVKQRKKKEQE